MSEPISYAVDLHMHSIHSDGLKTPTELCEMADKLHLTHVALCDHDTMDGVPEMLEAAGGVNEARKQRGDESPFTAIPCVEISTGRDGRTHILGYGADPHNPELVGFLSDAAGDRQTRAERMLALLEKECIYLPDDERQALISPHAGRAHIARALVRAGVVHTLPQAFDRYLGEGKCAYVARKHVKTAAAVQTLRRAGAVTVLAHPCRLGLEETALSALLDELKAAGLKGLEVYHPSAGRRNIRALAAMAEHKGLLVTGGSDYHGDVGAHAHMGKLPTGWHSMRRDVDALMAAMKDHHC